MTTFRCLAIAVLLTLSATAMGQTQDAAPRDAKAEPTKATFLLTGLHCPPCTRTVETSLAATDGILAIKVDWKTKSAAIDFDETVLSAQRVAQLIAATPHMMGPSMHYAGWLALKAPGVKDEPTAREAEKALSEVEGVKSAKAYAEQHVVAAFFDAKGDVTTQQLIDRLKEAGFEAENYSDAESDASNR